VPAIGLAICVLAAYRLRATPLFTAAVVVAALNAVAVVWAAVLARRNSRPRLATASKHVTAALGAFFLFVSFALPDVP
jgi:hypothetical protein